MLNLTLWGVLSRVTTPLLYQVQCLMMPRITRLWFGKKGTEVKWFYAAFGSCLLLVNGAFLLGVQVYPGIGREHGPMENFQAICLFLAALIFYICQRRVLTRGGSRLLWSLALFCATFLLVEFDTRHFGWPLLTYVTNGWIRDVWLALLWLFMSWVNRRQLSCPVGVN